MADFNWVAILVAVVGSGGLTAVVTTIIQSVKMHKDGVAGREDRRQDDIIKQRDDAYARARQAEIDASQEEHRADVERAARIRWQEAAARYRLQLIMAGIEPADHPTKE